MFGQEKRITLVSLAAAIATMVLKRNNPNKLVWMIFISVLVSTLDFDGLMTVQTKSCGLAQALCTLLGKPAYLELRKSLTSE